MNDIEIIIPAYNAHNTLKKTLESISIQKDLPKYHVTLVNDKGKDYKQIVDYYKKDLNIDEITTPENGGPGAARQYGIDNSKSKYIVFIDADDTFYDEHSLEKLYNKIEKTNADLVTSSFIYQRDGIEEIKKQDTIWLHGKIYKREFLEKNNIRFNNSRANEDNGFNNLVILLRPIIVLSKEITYVYNENPNSITRKNNREYKLSGLEGFAYNTNWSIEEAEKRNAYDEDLAWKTVEGLIVLYKNYNMLYKEYDVDKIFDWSIDLYKKYKKYEELINKTEKKLLEETTIPKKYISFEEFKNQISMRLNKNM